jgi:hypothetical protein
VATAAVGEGVAMTEEQCREFIRNLAKYESIRLGALAAMSIASCDVKHGAVCGALSALFAGLYFDPSQEYMDRMQEYMDRMQAVMDRLAR